MNGSHPVPLECKIDLQLAICLDCGPCQSSKSPHYAFAFSVFSSVPFDSAMCRFDAGENKIV